MDYAKYFSVVLASTIKFVGGPIAGFALGLSFWATVLCSALGMMLTVLGILFLKSFIGRFLGKNKNQKKFTYTSRLSVKIRNRFGIWGIALLTPFLLTPAGGTLIAVSFKYPKGQILGAMFLSACIGAATQSAVIYALPLLRSQFGF